MRVYAVWCAAPGAHDKGNNGFFHFAVLPSLQRDLSKESLWQWQWQRHLTR